MTNNQKPEAWKVITQVTSKTADVELFQSEQQAKEHAFELRSNGWEDVQIIPLYTNPTMINEKVLDNIADCLDEISSELLTASIVDNSWESKLSACSNIIYDIINRDRSHLPSRNSIEKQMIEIVQKGHKQ